MPPALKKLLSSVKLGKDPAQDDVVAPVTSPRIADSSFRLYEITSADYHPDIPNVVNEAVHRYHTKRSSATPGFKRGHSLRPHHQHHRSLQTSTSLMVVNSKEPIRPHNVSHTPSSPLSAVAALEDKPLPRPGYFAGPSIDPPSSPHLQEDRAPVLPTRSAFRPASVHPSSSMFNLGDHPFASSSRGEIRNGRLADGEISPRQTILRSSTAPARPELRIDTSALPSPLPNAPFSADTASSYFHSAWGSSARPRSASSSIYSSQCPHHTAESSLSSENIYDISQDDVFAPPVNSVKLARRKTAIYQGPLVPKHLGVAAAADDEVFADSMSLHLRIDAIKPLDHLVEPRKDSAMRQPSHSTTLTSRSARSYKSVAITTTTSSSSNLPPIRDIDWSKVSQETVEEFTQAYDLDGLDTASLSSQTHTALRQPSLHSLRSRPSLPPKQQQQQQQQQQAPRPLPARIADIDWSALSELETSELFAAYKNVSPCDSAVVVGAVSSATDEEEEDEIDDRFNNNNNNNSAPAAAYRAKDKGKGRMIDLLVSDPGVGVEPERFWRREACEAVAIEIEREVEMSSSSGDDEEEEEGSVYYREHAEFDEREERARRMEETLQRAIDEEERRRSLALQERIRREREEEAKFRQSQLRELRLRELEEAKRQSLALQERMRREAEEEEERGVFAMQQEEKRREEEEGRRRALAVEEERRRLEEEEERRIAVELAELKEQRRRIAAEKEKEEAEAARLARLLLLRDCTVCGDSKDAAADFPPAPPTSTCAHQPATCTACLQAWMASEFSTKGCDGLLCPECPSALGYNEVKLAASASVFAAYDKLATRTALGALDEFSWCLSPACDSGQLNTENSNFMDCISCGYKQCLRHRTAWHVGETCDQLDRRRQRAAQDEAEAERRTQAVLDIVSKKCPNPACGWRIQKIDGCDHMTCRRCRFEFCWVCFAAQAEIRRLGNTAHRDWCKFHSTNLDVTWPFNMH